MGASTLLKLCLCCSRIETSSGHGSKPFLKYGFHRPRPAPFKREPLFSFFLFFRGINLFMHCKKFRQGSPVHLFYHPQCYRQTYGTEIKVSPIHVDEIAEWGGGGGGEG